jgi:hypothetical protein
MKMATKLGDLIIIDRSEERRIPINQEDIDMEEVIGKFFSPEAIGADQNGLLRILGEDGQLYSGSSPVSLSSSGYNRIFLDYLKERDFCWGGEDRLGKYLVHRGLFSDPHITHQFNPRGLVKSKCGQLNTEPTIDGNHISYHVPFEYSHENPCLKNPRAFVYCLLCFPEKHVSQ